jgi:hypothetical protein
MDMAATRQVRWLSVRKGDMVYAFRYSPASEPAMLEEIIRQADDPQSELDWVDAATLAFQAACQSAQASWESMPTHSPKLSPRQSQAAPDNPGGDSDQAMEGPCSSLP